MADFKGTRIMAVNEHGDEEQIYVQTTADAVIGLKEFIEKVIKEQEDV